MDRDQEGGTVLHFELVADGFGSLEGPVFGRDGTLYVSDLKEGAVLSVAADGSAGHVLSRPQVGGMALHRSTGLVLSGSSVVHWTSTGVRTLATIDDVPHRGATAFNDLVAEPGSGAVVAGVLCVDPAGVPCPGQLVRIDGPGRVTAVFEGLHPNGLAYSADGRQLIAADTFGRRLIVLDSAPDGTLAASHAISTAAIDGLPDGIATDVDGGVWVAFYRGGCIARFDVATGRAAVHRFPVSKPLSLAFGPFGAGELFVVTGRHPEQGEPSGAVWHAASTAAGAPVAPAAV